MSDFNERWGKLIESYKSEIAKLEEENKLLREVNAKLLDEATRLFTINEFCRESLGLIIDVKVRPETDPLKVT